MLITPSSCRTEGTRTHQTSSKSTHKFLGFVFENGENKISFKRLGGHNLNHNCVPSMTSVDALFSFFFKIGFLGFFQHLVVISSFTFKMFQPSHLLSGSGNSEWALT